MSKYKDMSTDDLILAYRNGDERAFTALYMRYKGMVFYKLKKSLRDNQDIADDISQSIWLSVAKGLREDYRFESKFTTYLHTVIYTRFLNYLRNRWADDTLSGYEIDLADMLLYGSVQNDDSVLIESLSKMVLDSATDFEQMDLEEGIAIYDKVYNEVVGRLKPRDRAVFENHTDNGGGGHKDTAEKLGFSLHYVKKVSQRIYSKTKNEIKRRFYEELRNHNQNY